MTIVASGEMDLRLSPQAQSRLENDLNATLKKGAGSAGAPAANQFGKSFGGALGGVAAFTAIRTGFHFLADSVKEFTERGDLIAKTEAVLKSTGGQAGITGEHVSKLSEKLGELAAVDDDVVRGGANVLLTFTKVRNEVGKGNDVFDQATGLALDMSVALGSDLQGAIIQVGKALNDPIKGVTALSKVGVSFTQQQKDQIKVLVESGNVLGAQKIILGELKTEFGGVAEAVGDSLAGKVQRAGVAFGNLKESIGAGLAPALEKLAPLVSALAVGMSNLPPAAIQAGIGFGSLLAAGAVFVRIKALIDGTSGALSEMGRAGQIASTGLTVLGRAAGIAGIVGVLGVAAEELQKKLEGLKPNAEGAASAVIDFGKGAASLDDIIRAGGVNEGLDQLLTNAKAFEGDFGSATGSMSGFRSALAGVVEQVKNGGLEAGDGLDFLKDKLDGVDKGLATLASSGPANARVAADAATELSLALGLTVGEGGNSVKVLDDYGKAVEKAGLQAKISKTDSEAGADGIAGVGDEADTAAAKVKTLDDQIKLLSDGIQNSALGQFTSFESAQIRFAEAVNKLGEGLKTQGTSFDLSTEAGLKNRDALLNAISAAETYVEGLVRTGKVSQDQESVNAALVASLRQIETKFPALRGQIELYIAKLGEAPTELKLDADATPALNAIGKVNATPIPDKTFTIRPVTTQAFKNFAAQVGLPLPPGLAKGGTGPGLFMVGEDGPELLRLGSSRDRVFSNRDSRRMLNETNNDNRNVTVNINNPPNDADATAFVVARKLGQAAQR